MTDTTDFRIEEWLEQHGSTISVVFMVYGPFGAQDNAIVNTGLRVRLERKNINLDFVQSVKELTKEESEALQEHRGLQIMWVFPNGVDESTLDVISNTISDGLKYLNFNYKLIGVWGDEAF